MPLNSVSPTGFTQSKCFLTASVNVVVIVAEFVTMMTSKWGVVNGLSAIRPAFLLSILTLQWIGMRVAKHKH